MQRGCFSLTKTAAGSRTSVSPGKAFLKTCALALACALAAGAGLFCAAAAVLVRTDVPFALHQPITTVLLASAVFLVCDITCRKTGKNGLLTGLCVGAGVFLCLFAAGLICGTELTAQSLVKLAALTCAGALGGLVGMSRKVAAQTKKRKLPQGK